MSRSDFCPSPCVKKCGIDASCLCSGCLRTGKEIEAWPRMSNEEKWAVMVRVDERRAAMGNRDLRYD